MNSLKGKAALYALGLTVCLENKNVTDIDDYYLKVV